VHVFIYLKTSLQDVFEQKQKTKVSETSKALPIILQTDEY